VHLLVKKTLIFIEMHGTATTKRILVLFIYIIRLASSEIFSPSNKIHREVGRTKDLSTPTVHMYRGTDKFLA
jgi:hypothetical protein